ncbi:protein AF-10 [Cylas formicarius]|uniref:protein AF-10 n=1 Tax=Cylas formicarius TaxID=197179 RepID=UPI002958D271|nr:protein AF-10 [Cylas formicarius]
MREMVGGCCVCSDDRGWSENPLVYCDGQSCSVAVHQACYGIVTVPTGPWYCRKCESQERSVKVKCELCPSRYGALKRTDNQGWAHVVCALYIPEVRFGNVTTMEPIQLQLIPGERFNKVCYICQEKDRPANATVGACMQCNRVGCKQQFHVTCAQSLGLLCEEAGNYLDNVKYCGYCQHHYSKLKKGGNVKTIPPYKPVSDNQNSDSSSEKEVEGNSLKRNSSPALGKRKSASNNKGNSSKGGNSSNKTSGSQQKPVQSNSKGSSDKSKVGNIKSVKSEDSSNTETFLENSDKKDIKSDTADSDQKNKEPKDKDNKSSKKRKVNSRTPTPVQSEVSVVVSVTTTNTPPTSSTTSVSSVPIEKRSTTLFVPDIPAEKSKKSKVETTQSIIFNQPVVALTSISTLTSTSTSKGSSPTVTTAELITNKSDTSTTVTSPSIIQTAQAQVQQQQIGSLLVSVPLANTSIGPHNPIINNQTSVLAVTPFQPHSQEKEKSLLGNIPKSPMPIIENDSIMLTGEKNEQGILTSEMSGGGLKITYEKQTDSINMEVDMELELDPAPAEAETPAKRGSRSQSHEKSDRTTRNKKRNSANGVPPPQSNNGGALKRSSRSQHSTPPPSQQPPGAFAAISQSQIKDSPPSSPSSESLGSQSTSHRGRTKGRKSAPAAVNTNSNSVPLKENKDVKLFQNGIAAAPHMLGNQLNPNSNMHQKMTDHLNSELEAHSVYNNSNDTSPLLVGPQMHHRVVQLVRASSTGSSTASGGSGLSSMLGGNSGTIPQTLDQLLERQWEQGSQFLMEQAQHFDIASLLSCLHQLRAENLRLEEHVSSLLQRRDHLLAVNARLAIPLTGQPATPQPSHPHTVNNIHPNIAVNHVDISRPPRHNSGNYDRHSQSSQHAPVENGLPPDTYPQNPHRSPVNSGQPSPTIRHSSTGSFPNNGLIRQNADTGGRSAPPRSQPYPLFDRPGSSSSQQQMVIRRDRERDSEMHHHNNSKPS